MTIVWHSIRSCVGNAFVVIDTDQWPIDFSQINRESVYLQRFSYWSETSNSDEFKFHFFFNFSKWHSQIIETQQRKPEQKTREKKNIRPICDNLLSCRSVLLNCTRNDGTRSHWNGIRKKLRKKREKNEMKSIVNFAHESSSSIRLVINGRTTNECHFIFLMFSFIFVGVIYPFGSRQFVVWFRFSLKTFEKKNSNWLNRLKRIIGHRRRCKKSKSFGWWNGRNDPLPTHVDEKCHSIELLTTKKALKSRQTTHV